MVEEQKIIRRSNMMVGTAAGFDPYVNSSSSNPNEFFNFEQHNSASHNSDLFWKPTSPSSSAKPMMIAGVGAGDFCQFDESSLQRCVLIPCEPNERPSQGLSLSLSSTNPSTIGIQPFELVRPPPPQDHHHHHHHHHQGYFGKPMNMHEQHDMMTDNQENIINMGSGGAQQYNIRSSRYLLPAQGLLTEFCNLGTKHNDHSSKTKPQRISQWQDHDHNINASSSKNKPFNSLEFLELQKRKSKLLQMLEEV